MGTDAGFDPDRVLASFTLPRAGYSTPASVRSFHHGLFTRASSQPGVRHSALATDFPLDNCESRALTPDGDGSVTRCRRRHLNIVEGRSVVAGWRGRGGPGSGTTLVARGGSWGVVWRTIPPASTASWMPPSGGC
jgi:hypothetical protein